MEGDAGHVILIFASLGIWVYFSVRKTFLAYDVLEYLGYSRKGEYWYKNGECKGKYAKQVLYSAIEKENQITRKSY